MSYSLARCQWDLRGTHDWGESDVKWGLCDFIIGKRTKFFLCVLMSMKTHVYDCMCVYMCAYDIYKRIYIYISHMYFKLLMGGQGERAAARNKSTRYNRTLLMQTTEMSVHVYGKYGCMFMLWRMSTLLLFVKMLRFGQRNDSSLMTPEFMWRKEREPILKCCPLISILGL